MGRIKKQRGPRKTAGSGHLGRVQAPQDVHWTPFEHPCNCVVDWGWDSTTCPPPTFMTWCQGVIGSDCPWHGAETGLTILSPAGDPIAFSDPSGNGPTFYARMATEDAVPLGRRLTREMAELQTLTGQGRPAVIAAIHPKQKAWLQANGYDPADAWRDQRLTDIILNRGRASIPKEALDRLEV